jgi:molybdenum cofactor biosynthesis enzyme MoaA
MEAVVSFAGKCRFENADITGGSPELVPDLPSLVERLSALVPRLMLRTNLTALAEPGRDELLSLCISRHVDPVRSEFTFAIQASMKTIS